MLLMTHVRRELLQGPFRFLSFPFRCKYTKNSRLGKDDPRGYIRLGTSFGNRFVFPVIEVRAAFYEAAGENNTLIPRHEEEVEASCWSEV